MNGGTLVACGSAGMIETPANNSDQCSVVYNVPTYVNIGDKIIVKNSNNEIIYSLIVSKKHQSIVISLPKFELNATYTIIAGTNTETITLNSILTRIGNTMGPGGPGGMPPSGGRPPRP